MQENKKYAATYYLGGTTVHIDNSKVAKTRSEKKQALVEVKHAVLNILEDDEIKKAKYI